MTPPERKIVSTGSLHLDYALGVGGLVQGRIYEVWGPEGSAKSTMNLVMAAEQQKAAPDKVVAWVDMEQTYEPAWAAKHGVDPARMIVLQPDDAEQVADQVCQLMESGQLCYVVLDSVGAMIPKHEFEIDAGDATVGLAAKVITRMVKMAAVRGRQNGCTLMIVNQVRANIAKHGPSQIAAGGYARGHVSSARFKSRRAAEDPLKVGKGEDERIVGREFAWVVEKNKIAPEGLTANFTLFNQDTPTYGPTGLDRASEAFVLGKRFGLFEVGHGGRYELSDGTKIHGEKAMKAHFRENPTLIENIRQTALKQIAHTVDEEALNETGESPIDLDTAEASA
jgi:recombination protein RecA